MSKTPRVCEILIVGGGPAGLSAALVLGRARRKVLVCDSKEYRNASTKKMHGFLSRDGISPTEFRAIAHEELSRYGSVKIEFQKVEDITRHENGVDFDATLADGTLIFARKVILATGLKDHLPEVDGAREVYGRRLFHCPYCDGWEFRDQALCIYGRGDAKGAGLALEMTQWTRNIKLCTDGPSGISEKYRERLKRWSIKLDERKIKRLSEEGDGLRVEFDSGDDVNCKAMFFNTHVSESSDLADRLGCNSVKTAHRLENMAGKTCITGVYITGDASRDALQVIVAAGEGSAAAIALNTELLRDDGIL